MATKLVYSTLVAALGGFGPRAQYFALAQGRDVASDARALATRLAPARGMGDAGILGGVLSFIPDTLKGIGSIGANIPSIEAASGMKSAQEYETQQAALKQTELQAKLVSAEGTAASSTIAAWAPWAAIGVGGIALAATLAYVASKKFGAPPKKSNRRFGVGRRAA